MYKMQKLRSEKFGKSLGKKRERVCLGAWHNNCNILTIRALIGSEFYKNVGEDENG